MPFPRASKKAQLRAWRGHKIQAMTVLSAKQRCEGGRKPPAARTIDLSE
jgi:hypothetical protein